MVKISDTHIGNWNGELFVIEELSIMESIDNSVRPAKLHMGKHVSNDVIILWLVG
jgi:hypothetical protein